MCQNEDKSSVPAQMLVVGEVILCQDNRLWHIGLPGGKQITSYI
jgi:hypothetical protein